MKKPEPFHAVRKLHNDKLIGYDIYVVNRPFLKQANKKFPLKRAEAYAIARLLNSEKRLLKWAEKFSDPYE